MTTARTPHALLAWAALLLTPTTAWWLGTRTWEAVRDTAWGSASINDAALAMVGGIGTLVGAYLTASTVALVLGHVAAPGPRARLLPWTPAAWRRLVAAALGMTVASGVAAPAMATTQEEPPVNDAPSAGWVQTPDEAHVSSTVVDVSDPEPVAASASPSPSVAAPTATAPAAEPGITAHLVHAEPPTSVETVSDVAAPDESDPDESETATTVTVERGDSLWRITAGLLPADASDGDIAAAWPLLYRENREVIGDNPSLIHPGQELTIPSGLSS